MFNLPKIVRGNEKNDDDHAAIDDNANGRVTATDAAASTADNDNNEDYNDVAAAVTEYVS
jgi:hypothetical protein